MAVSPAERQYILSQIGRAAEADLKTLWQQAEALPSNEFARFIIEAFPELADPYAALAADAAAVWYDDSPTPSVYVATPGPLPVAEQLTSSATWALGATGTEGLTRLQGTLQRTVFDAARDTVLHNVDSEPGARWARHASANACAFCAMAATRGAVYTSKAAAETVVGRRTEITLGDRRKIAAGLMTREQAYENRARYVSARAAAKAGKAVGDEKARQTRGVQKLGKKYHDHCHCIAVEVRPGQSYQPPEYVQKWEEAYIAASRETPKVGKYGAIDPTAVLAHMRASLGTH